MHYTLRDARPADCDAMMHIGHDGIKPYVEQLWRWNPAEQQEAFRKQFEPKWITIIQVDGQDVGYFKLQPKADHTFLAGIYIDASHRQSGLGTKVLSDIIKRHQASHHPLRLQVLKANPAHRLYRRLGFQVIEETETHRIMEHAKQ